MRLFNVSFFLLVGLSVTAQIYAPGPSPTLGASSNNDVGIGISQPAGNLHIKGRDGVGIVLDVGVGGSQIGGGYAATSYPFELRYTNNITSPATVNALKARLHNSGRLDLGIDFSAYPVNAMSRLNVLNSMAVYGSTNGYLLLNNNNLRWYNSGSSPFSISYGNANNNSGTSLFEIAPNGDATFMGNAVVSNGYLAINTTNTVGNHALYVGGSIIGEEVVVKSQGSWPDYVFDPDYDLCSLEDLEMFIESNRHLPGVPSAAEVTEVGQALGANQQVLLEKVEELTLYMIQLNKELEAAKTRIAELEEELN